MKIPFKKMMETANAAVEVIPAEKAISLVDDTDVVIVDIRDSSEIKQHGHIPGAVQIPRGSLEFRVHPESPFYDPVFAKDKKFVFV